MQLHPLPNYKRVLAVVRWVAVRSIRHIMVGRQEITKSGDRYTA